MEIKIVFEFDIPNLYDPVESAERLMKEYCGSTDSLIDVAWVFVKKNGQWIEHDGK